MDDFAEVRQLTPDESAAIRVMVESRLQEQVEALDGRGCLYGALYDIQWIFSTFDEQRAERLAWLLAEMKFVVESVRESSAPSLVPGVVDTYFSICASRPVALLPDALVGEALVLESVAVNWGASLHSFSIPTQRDDVVRAMRSLHGPLGKDIC